MTKVKPEDQAPALIVSLPPSQPGGRPQTNIMEMRMDTRDPIVSKDNTATLYLLMHYGQHLNKGNDVCLLRMSALTNPRTGETGVMASDAEVYCFDYSGNEIVEKRVLKGGAIARLDKQMRELRDK